MTNRQIAIASLSAAALAALISCTHAETKAEAKPAELAPVDAGTPPPPPPPPEPPKTADAEFRATKPAPAPGPSLFHAPVPSERTLKSGAKLLVVENHAVPLVSVDVLIATGTDGEQPGKSGLAGFVADMLDEGTLKHPAQELADRIEDLAANISANAGQETTRIHLNCLKETLPEALALFAEVVTSPAFKSEDVERVRGLKLTELAQRKANPGQLARDEMMRIAFGEKSAWGQPAEGTPESIKAVTIADLQKFHGDWYRPNNAIISVSGDVTEGEIAALLEAQFASWKKRALPKRAAEPKAKFTARTITLVDKPGASQSQVWVFGAGVAAKDPDAVALRLASNILGGPFARLDLNLREEKGYSYGVRAALTMMRNQGLWAAQGGIKAAVTAEALTEYEKELVGFSNGQLKAGELEKAKESLVRSLPSQLETNDAVAAAMARMRFDGLPLDYFKTLPDRVAKVDAAEIARVTVKYLSPGKWPVVIVGPKAASFPKVCDLNLGPVDVKMADGSMAGCIQGGVVQ